MFNGEETEVTIKFTNDLAGVVFDRFGVDIPIVRENKTHFTCRLKVAVSRQFLSWIISFGDRAKVISPDTVQEQLCELAESAMRQYRK